MVLGLWCSVVNKAISPGYACWGAHCILLRILCVLGDQKPTSMTLSSLTSKKKQKLCKACVFASEWKIILVWVPVEVDRRQRLQCKSSNWGGGKEHCRGVVEWDRPRKEPWSGAARAQACWGALGRVENVPQSAPSWGWGSWIIYIANPLNSGLRTVGGALTFQAFQAAPLVAKMGFKMLVG